ncbi:unnamed protein product, partial [Polarella glacialis]
FYFNPLSDAPGSEEDREKFPWAMPKNIWPKEIAELEPHCKALGKAMHEVCAGLAVQVDKIMGDRVKTYDADLGPTVSETQKCKGRLLYYFPPAKAPDAGEAAGAVSEDGWIGWHNDSGFLTALTPDMYVDDDTGAVVPNPDPDAGLWVVSRDGNAVPVKIPSDCMAIQVGECLQVVTGGELVATPHCVRGCRPSHTGGRRVARVSCPCFIDTHPSFPVRMPEGCSREEVLARGFSAKVPPLGERWTEGATFGDFLGATFRRYYAMHLVYPTCIGVPMLECIALQSSVFFVNLHFMQGNVVGIRTTSASQLVTQGNLPAAIFLAGYDDQGGKCHISRDLMELTDNDVSGAVSLISFLLRCEQAPFEMQNAAGRCLVQLTTADSVFLNQSEDGSAPDFQNQQIAKLTGMLNRHVNGLIKGLIQFDIVEAFGRCICQHQMSHTRTDIVVKHFLTTIHNSLLYCSENQKKLRQHLATQSTIVQDIMIPYVHNILPALYDNPSCGPSLLEWQNLKSTLQTFVVVTFNINVFRPQLRDNDLLPKVCEVPNILTHVTALELLMKLAINVDYTKGPYCDMLTAVFQGAFDRLNPENQARLQRRLVSEQSTRLPFARSSVKACELLAFALSAPTGEEATPEAAATRRANKKHKWRSGKAKRRKRLFALHSADKGATDGDGEGGDEDGEDDSDDDDMPALISADGWEGTLGAADEAGIPSKALCQLSGSMMTDPVSTPDGYLFDRAALEDWTSQHATNPLTGAPLAMDECAERADIQSYIQGYQMQMLSACEIAPEAFEQPLALSAADVPAAAPVLTTGPSLLGDLPNLSRGGESPPRAKKEKSKIRIESRSVVDCPDDMRCAVDGKVMVNPVRSPYGHFFERKTLERWMQNCGSVCPITGKSLRLEECEPDAETKKRIVKFLKGQA